MNARLKKAYDWVNERVHLEDLVNFLGKKYVPVHRHSIWYYFGGVSLFGEFFELGRLPDGLFLLR